MDTFPGYTNIKKTTHGTSRKQIAKWWPLNTRISKTISNINWLNTSVKRQKLSHWIKK